MTWRTVVLASMSLLAAGCLPHRAPSVAPGQVAAVAAQRQALRAAIDARRADLDGVLSPGARLIVAGDTSDLRGSLQRFGAAAGDSLHLWVAPYALRRCDRWLYESGGQLGTYVDRGGRQSRRELYRYAATWTTDSVPTLQDLAVVRGDGGGSPPVIEGCRPAVRDRFDARRLSVSILPGSGLTKPRVVPAVESGMRSQSYATDGISGPAGYESGGRAPAIAAVAYRVTRRLSLEALATLATGAGTATGADTIAQRVTGVRQEQRWGALVASFHLGSEVEIGAGPAVAAEAWHVEVAEYQRVGSRWQEGGPIASAGSNDRRVGFITQAKMRAPVTPNFFLELRGWYLGLGSSTSPAAFGLTPIKATSSSFGLGVLLGAAL